MKSASELSGVWPAGDVLYRRCLLNPVQFRSLKPIADDHSLDADSFR